jgi:hypothetical protein
VAIDPMKVWANMSLKTWPERYWMIDLESAQGAVAMAALSASVARYCCVIRDQAGLSVVVDDKTWAAHGNGVPVRDKFGPFRVVSTDGELPFNVIGFVRPVLQELNGAAIKAGPQCGAVFDHLFISSVTSNAPRRCWPISSRAPSSWRDRGKCAGTKTTRTFAECRGRGGMTQPLQLLHCARRSTSADLDLLPPVVMRVRAPDAVICVAFVLSALLVSPQRDCE